jgi:hypothetical protein
VLTVTLYTRRDCHLCDVARADLESLGEETPHRVVEIDIDSDPLLARKFGEKVPVVEVGPYRLGAPITRQSLRMTLTAASDRKSHLERMGDTAFEGRRRRGKAVTFGDRLSHWMTRHYLAIVNLFMLTYVGLPVLAPILMKAGQPAPARLLYAIYSPLCHQFGFRSFFLFGAQAEYPLAQAGAAKRQQGCQRVFGDDEQPGPSASTGIHR